VLVASGSRDNVTMVSSGQAASVTEDTHILLVLLVVHAVAKVLRNEAFLFLFLHSLALADLEGVFLLHSSHLGLVHHSQCTTHVAVLSESSEARSRYLRKG